MPESSRRTSAWTVVSILATLALTISTTVVAWWLIGDQSTERNGNAIIRVPARTPEQQLVLAKAAVLVGAIALTLLVVATVLRDMDWRWWSVVGLVAASGIPVAWIWRMLTLRASGASFGMLAVFYGLPFVTMLLALAVVQAAPLLGRQFP